MVGTQTAAIKFAGFPALDTNESWNGTAWTEVNNLNTARFGCGGAGTTTAGLIAGGTSKTESWDGSSWAAVADMSTGRDYLSGAVTNTLALAAGGGTATVSNATEEWAFATSKETVAFD